MLYLSITAVVAAALAWDFGRKHLAARVAMQTLTVSQKSSEVERLEARLDQELKERNITIEHWIKKFSGVEKQLSALETAVRAIQPRGSANPTPYNIRG